MTTDTSGTLNSQDKCKVECGEACCHCNTPLISDHTSIRSHVTNELEKQRNWIVADYFVGNAPDAPPDQRYGILPAMMLLTEQLTSVGIQQVQIIGSFLDAKHQLETQRLFQQLTARAHKDYHLSEGLCEIGTNVRSLLPSQRRADLTQTAFSQRVMSRALLSGETTTIGGAITDKRSRLDQFIKKYCNKADNGKGLDELCAAGTPDKKRINKDVDYTRTLETPLTLDVDLLTATTASEDAEDIFALTSNLFAHEVSPFIKKELLASSDGKINRDAGHRYLDVRALAAKRSVAQNSVAALTAMKSKGSPESAPFLKRWVEEMGIPKAEIEKYIGKEPSYFAQMEVLTKKIYQNPVFYADLYDKPVNVERKAAALEAIGLMQDRDIYRSLLRSEMVLAVFLDTLLEQEQERVSNKINLLAGTGQAGQNSATVGGGGTP